MKHMHSKSFLGLINDVQVEIIEQGEFPVRHKEFYNSFEAWRKIKYIANQVQEGVYLLLANKPVPRCLKVDESGILYIGKGRILNPNHRLGKLINSINKTEFMHDAGKRYNHEVFSKTYGIDNMKLGVVVCKDSKNAEMKLLGQCVFEFGELPPLNHSL